MYSRDADSGELTEIVLEYAIPFHRRIKQYVFFISPLENFIVTDWSNDGRQVYSLHLGKDNPIVLETSVSWHSSEELWGFSPDGGRMYFVGPRTSAGRSLSVLQACRGMFVGYAVNY